jgi:Putative outer membrane beta-barrel porin, MtrB/PioB
MRNRALMTTAALALASSMAAAQTPSPNPAPAPGPTAPTVGTIDFGAYVGGTDGDGARFERYRDTRDGVYSDFAFHKQTATYFADASANHLGYRDQRIALDYARSWGSLSFLFDSTPTNYLYDATTPWTRGTTLSLPDNLQGDVQNRRVNGVPCAYASTCNNPANAALALANRSIYNTALNVYDLQSKRETLRLSGLLSATRDLGITLAFASTKKSGEMPWAGSHAFNNANEFPVTLDHRTNDFSTGVEWSRPKGMLRVGWDGSFFSNSNQTLVWDNPLRLTDFSNGTASPWDASGYTNGNGAAQGRMALWPSSTQHVVSTTGMYKLAKRTNINGTLQFTNQSQNEQLIPWTINNVINSAVGGAQFAELRELPRDTAEAKVSGVHALLNFTTRPMRYLALQARYRYNDRDVKTPAFDAREYVRFDAVPEEIEEGISHQYDITRQNFDASATFSLRNYGALKAGYGHEAFERHGRGFSDVGENILRLSYDAMNLGVFTIRTGFDVAKRRGLRRAGHRLRARPRRHAARPALLRRVGSRPHARHGIDCGQSDRCAGDLFPGRARHRRIPVGRIGPGRP